MSNQFTEYADLYKFTLRQFPLYIQTIKIQIPNDHRSFISSMASMRSSIHRNHNSQSIYTANYEVIGLMGELAFEMFTGAPMDKAIKKEGDDFDFLINGKFIDVKATKSSDPKLYVKKRRLKEYFIYVLSKVNLDTLEVELFGWIYGKEVLQKGFEQNNVQNYEDAYIIGINQLNNINTLKQELNL